MAVNDTKNMTSGKPMGLLFFFALPLMLGNVFQQLYTVVDTAIIGRGVGLDALAALGTVDWLNWLIISLVFGFTQGFSVKLAQKFGEGDLPGLKRNIGLSLRLSIVISLITVAVGQLALPLFLRFLKVPSELVPIAEVYVRILMAGIPGVVFYNFCASVLQSVGNAKTPLHAMMIASLLNIGLDTLVVFVFGWGVAGAAGATVFSQFVSGLFCIRKVLRTPETRFALSDLRKDWEGERILLGLGYPIALKNVSIAVGGVIVQRVVNTFGMAFIAGMTAGNKLFGLLEIAAISYSYAVTTYVGQNYGARDKDRIHAGIKAALILALATSVVIGAVMLLFGRSILSLFIAADSAQLSVDALRIGYQFVALMAICLPFLYLNYVYRSVLQGIGNTVPPMLSGFLAMGIRIIVSLIVAQIRIPEWIFFAEVGSWLASLVYLFVMFLLVFRRLSFEPTTNE